MCTCYVFNICMIYIYMQVADLAIDKMRKHYV